MTYKFVVVEKDGKKELIPVNQSFYKDFETGDVVIIQKENQLQGLIKEMIKSFDKDVIVNVEDSRRRHGFFIILDNETKPMNASTAFFVADDCTPEITIKHLPELYDRLSFISYSDRSSGAEKINYALTKNGIKELDTPK